MVFRRRRSIQPIIQSDKHEIVFSNLAQDASSVATVPLIAAVQPANKDTATEVEIGSKVVGMLFEVNFSPEAAAVTKILHWEVVMTRLGQTVAIPSLYYQPDRSQILKRGMEMLVKDVATQTKRIFYVSIPKFMQRMKENMKFEFRYIVSSAETINICGFIIFKEKS